MIAFTQTWYGNARPPFCSLHTASFASFGVKVVFHETWEMPRPSPCTRTEIIEVTKLDRHLPLKPHGQTVCQSIVSTASTTRRSHLPWVPMWLSSQTFYSGHDLLPSAITGEVQGTLEAPLYSLMKAFDLVSWDGLFNILLMIGCPLKLHSMIILFHDSMRATIQYKGNNYVQTIWH